jgi:glycosyltransferase involved in cell wall biosynthesis
MSPIYARLAAPLARPLGVRVLLWYTQWRTNPLLERAVRAADVVLTVDEHSFPFASPKVRVIGHGIDVGRFRCTEPAGGTRLRLLALGRYAEVKEIPTLLRAAAEVGAELELHGSCETDGDRAHLPELKRLAAEVGARAEFGDAVTPAAVPELLARADALVSATRGGADKAVLEAGAACVPAFAAAPAFAALLPAELRFDGAAELAARLRAFAALSGDERTRLGRALRERVAAEHSVETWAERVLEAAGLA